jgi:YD repeat-containing protein
MHFLEFVGLVPKIEMASIDYEYDAAHNMSRMKDSEGFDLQNKYDAANRLIHQKLSDGRTWSFQNQVDKMGNILQTDVTNPDQTVERITFDLDHNTLTESYPLGHSEEIKLTYERNAPTGQVVAVSVKCMSKTGTRVQYRGVVGSNSSSDDIKRRFRANCRTIQVTN